MMPLRRVLLIALPLAACGNPQSAPRPEAVPLVTLPSAPAALREISSRPAPDGYAALGLSGANKPNGMEQRLRRSVPPETPAWMPRSLDGLKLWIADAAPEGRWLGFFRGPLELRPDAENARFRAALFSPGGERLWELELNRFLSRPDHLEIQDVRLVDGALFFNEACQSYSREAEGRCSSLVRVDPERGTAAWRSRPLVSNDIFIPHDRFLVAGYGFTSEPDSLFLVERSTGEIAARYPLDSAHSYLEIVGGQLVVVTRNRVYRIRVG